MSQPRSLQWRLALWLGGLFSLVILIASVSVTALMRHEMNEVFDSALQETAQRVLPLAVMELIGTDDAPGGRSIARLTSHEEYLTYVVTDRDNKILLRSHDARIKDFPPYRFSGYLSTQNHRIYYETAVQGSYRIAVAEPLNHRNEVTTEMFLTLAVPLLIGVPVGLLLVWWVVRLSLRPIHQLQTEVGRRTGKSLDPVTETGLPSEITPLAEAINRLLERLQQSLEAERSFSRNAAHEIRTPLAAALAQTQRLRAATKENATAERALIVEQSLRRLTRLADKLLQLAQADSARALSVSPFDVAPVFDLVMAEFDYRDAHGPELRIHYPPTPGQAWMDPDAWAILLRNLVENALKYGDPKTPVEVTLSENGEVRVTNGGPPVPADWLARLTRPFERASNRTEGSGLGLALAQTLARAAGGELILNSPVPGRDDGFEAHFKLAPGPKQGEN